MKFEILFASDSCQTFTLQPAKGKDGKLGTSKHSSKPFLKPTPEQYAAHISGARCLAVKLKRSAVLDVDPKNHLDFDAALWVADRQSIITEAKLVATISKSGGVRLWRCVEEYAPEKLIRPDLEYWAEKLASDDVEIEIFPDRDRLVMLPYFGDACGMIDGRSRDTFLGKMQSVMMPIDDLGPPTATALDLSDNRNQTLLSIQGSMLARGMDRDKVAEIVESLFWAEQANRPGESDTDGKREIADILKTGSRQESSSTDDAFSNLVRVEPKIKTPLSMTYYRFDYLGEPVTIERADDLEKFPKVRTAILNQLGALVPRLRADHWDQILGALIEKQETVIAVGESPEDQVAYLIESYIKRSFGRDRGPTKVPHDPRRLGVGTGEAWLDLDKDRIWYLPAFMLSYINTSPLGIKLTTHKLAHILRSLGGDTSPLRIRGMPNTVHAHWMPLQPGMRVAYLDALAAHESDDAVGDFTAKMLAEQTDHEHRTRPHETETTSDAVAMWRENAEDWITDREPY